MKVTVDVDCTPEEARRFLGLPDLAPVHAAYVARMEQMMKEGIAPEYFTEMLKNWAPMGEQSMALWQQMLSGMGGVGEGKQTKR